MFTKKNRSNVSSGGNMTISTILMEVKSPIFKEDPGFIPRDDTSEIVDLKFIALPEKFPRNLDVSQFLTGGEDVRNPFEVYPPQVQFLRTQSLRDIAVKRQSLCNLLLRHI
jgi:hypothetical protein